MNYEWIGKTIQKTIRSKKLKKTGKNRSKTDACEQKNYYRESEFVQTPFSHSIYFKIRANNFHAAKALAFSLQFLLRRDQNHYSNLTSKIIKMCEEILKKTAPQYNSISLNWRAPN